MEGQCPTCVSQGHKKASKHTTKMSLMQTKGISIENEGLSMLHLLSGLTMAQKCIDYSAHEVFYVEDDLTLYHLQHYHECVKKTAATTYYICHLHVQTH